MAPDPPADAKAALPNIQLYRPQLTSVLSIVNRITGVLSEHRRHRAGHWLAAAAAGPQAYAVVKAVLASWIGQVILFGCTFAFFLHFSAASNLVWDTVHGFELRAIYMSGWTVVAASAVMTAVAWIASVHMRRIDAKERELDMRTPLARAIGLGSAKDGSDIGGCNASRRLRSSR